MSMGRETGPATILFAAGADFFGGAERALLLTARALDPRRYRPVVVVGTDGELRAQLRCAGVGTEHVPLRRTDWRGAGAWAWSVLALARVARRERARLIHANEIPSAQPAGYAGRLLGLPVVTHARFPDHLGAAAWFLKPGFERVLFVSEYLRREGLREAPDVFRGRSDVLYDGVELPPMLDREARIAARIALGLPADVPAVILAGQVADLKGIWDYVSAAELLCHRGVPGVFVVMGDDLRGGGARRRAMETRVQALGLADRFRFLGFRRDAPRLMPLFDVAAVPSHVEPLGNATLEAMAAACPVVGSRVGGIPEMIVDGRTGTLVPAQSPSELATALELFLRDPERRRSYGGAGRHRAREAFGLEAHAAKLQAIYDGVLGMPGGVPSTGH
jgi:glycosyltransferase involved in cell wall biosynthesis